MLLKLKKKIQPRKCGRKAWSIVQGCLLCFVLSVLMDVLPALVLLLTKNKWTTKWIRKGPTENGTYLFHGYPVEANVMCCELKYKIIRIQNVVVF